MLRLGDYPEEHTGVKMNKSATARLRRHFLRFALAALFSLALATAAACGSDPEPTPAPATAAPEPTAIPTSEPQTGEDGDGNEHTNGDSDGGEHKNGDSDAGHGSGTVEAPANGDSDGGDASSGQSSASSSEDSTDKDGGADSGSGSDGSGSGSDGTVSRENPGGEGMLFDNSRNLALSDAQPLNIIRWTVEPTISAGALEAEGVLELEATIFNPMADGEGSGFSVFYKGHEESMVELLPDLGPMMIWDTFLTVAPTEMEIEGLTFKIRAYSPLFMDSGPDSLELRVYGYLPSGDDALLAVQDIKVE